MKVVERIILNYFLKHLTFMQLLVQCNNIGGLFDSEILGAWL